MKLLAAKKVPGKNTIVTSAMVLIWRESLLAAKANVTLVSPWNCGFGFSYCVTCLILQ